MNWKRQDEKGACLSVICIAALWITSLWLYTTSSDLDYFMFRILCCSAQHTQRFCYYSPLLVPLRPVTNNGGTARALKIGAVWGVTPKPVSCLFCQQVNLINLFCCLQPKKIVFVSPSLSFMTLPQNSKNPSWWIIFVQTLVFLLNRVYLWVWTRCSLVIGCSGEQISAWNEKSEKPGNALPIYCSFSLFFSSTSSSLQLFIRQILGYVSQSGVKKCCLFISIYDSSLFVRASYSCEHHFAGVPWDEFLEVCTNVHFLVVEGHCDVTLMSQ